MKIRFNEKGQGTYEFLTISVLCLVLSAILLYIVINNNLHEKFEVFKYNAKTVGINAVNYNYSTSEDVVYLYELIESNLVTEIKNNFSGDDLCDMYESKVVFGDDSKQVTLKCGKYLIYNQNIGDDKYDDYDIYKVSDWSFESMSGDNIDSVMTYGLIYNGKNVLDDYYEEDLFVKLVARKYGSEYSTLNKIKSNFKVDEKMKYRKRVLVDD